MAMTKKNTFSSLENLRSLSISSGAVFLGPWAGIDHEKFLIVAGVAEDRILVCSVMINSQIISSGSLTAEEIAMFF